MKVTTTKDGDNWGQLAAVNLEPIVFLGHCTIDSIQWITYIYSSYFGLTLGPRLYIGVLCYSAEPASIMFVCIAGF